MHEVLTAADSAFHCGIGKEVPQTAKIVIQGKISFQGKSWSVHIRKRKENR
jgi:hypothetical protein